MEKLEIYDTLSFSVWQDVIAILLIGETLSEETLKNIKTIIARNTTVMGPGSGILLDWFPFIRYFGNKSYATLMTSRKDVTCIMRRWLKIDLLLDSLMFCRACLKRTERNLFLAQRMLK